MLAASSNLGRGNISHTVLAIREELGAVLPAVLDVAFKGDL